MHETGLALEIAEIAMETLKNCPGPCKAESLHLKVGRWSGVEPETLAFALEVVCHGTELEGVRAEIEVVEPTFICSACGECFSPETRFDSCPKCGGAPGKMTGGDEFILTHIEVED